MMSPDALYLVTGYPTSRIAIRVVNTLLESRPACRVRCIVSPTSMTAARERIGSLPSQQSGRVVLLEGEPWGLDLSLSGREWRELAEGVHVIHHASQTRRQGIDRDEAMRVNRGSTVEALELAGAAPELERLVIWSSASVSGSRRGFVLEDELESGYPARSPVEESLRKSEELVRRAMGDLPITVLRPGVIAGDSTSGELDLDDGLARLIALMLNADPDRPMPLPVRSGLPLPLVPIDYVVAAGLRIATDPRSRGRTFHIVDPDPLTAERVFELLARAVGRRTPRTFLPPFIANQLMRLPGLQPGGSLPLPREFLDQIATEVVYDDRGARELLAGSGLSCPPFESILEAMVRYVKAHNVSRGSSSSAREAFA